ncbi:fructosamine kinase [Ancylomarina longa]|uniref:Fructosamine kinase n=1 Tax=Ancylomarina longa TaxID=2487017 RepID=A0A434AX42_9BACT|nr:fructosamine kinase [Ancylomarina longa]
MRNDIVQKLENWRRDKISAFKPIAGGSIFNAYQIKYNDGSFCFLKTSSDESDIFQKEANGLHEIQKTGCIRVPEVLMVDQSFILLKFIDPGKKKENFFSNFGEQIAKLHSHTSLKFGYREDNHIGSTIQINIAAKNDSLNWADFYYHKRLLYQYKLAEKKGLVRDELKNGFLLLENRIEEILAGSEEKACLIHGDLWYGNFLCDKESNPVLIDPAVYYGHREAELAMTRLFGGFTKDFYEAYNKAKPLPHGYDYRENIYFLYHVLNHLNIFGSSYYPQAVKLVWSYLC